MGFISIEMTLKARDGFCDPGRKHGEEMRKHLALPWGIFTFKIQVGEEESTKGSLKGLSRKEKRKTNKVWSAEKKRGV